MRCFDRFHASAKSDGFEERYITKNIQIFHLAKPSPPFTTNLRTPSITVSGFSVEQRVRFVDEFMRRISESAREGAFSGQGDYFFFDKQLNVQNKILILI